MSELKDAIRPELTPEYIWALLEKMSQQMKETDERFAKEKAERQAAEEKKWAKEEKRWAALEKRWAKEEEKRKLYHITDLGTDVLNLEIQRIERLYKNSRGVSVDEE